MGGNSTPSAEKTSVQRRKFLQLGTSAAGLAIAGQLTMGSGRAMGQPVDDPFTLGVASGDPTPDSVVIWTRLAPNPLEADGGMRDRGVEIAWQVAHDEAMTEVVRGGVATARPEYVHSVHVDVRGLQPDRVYYYRFRVGQHLSPVGRTRTSPTTDAQLQGMSFAFASCQNFSHGHFTSHQHLAEEDVDFVLFLGDYIYDTPGDDDLGRLHRPQVDHLTSLADYRTRHTQYRLDPGLQSAHAAAPWIVTLDNHDVRVGYAGFWQKDGLSPEQIAQHRANGFRAAWEHLPMRKSRIPDGPYFKLYQSFQHGDLATFNILDTRQYADAHVGDCPVEDRISGYCPEALDPTRTILGKPQREWLLNSLDNSGTRWNVLGNPFFFTQHDHDPDPELRSFNPKWDHYVADRQRLLDHITDRGLTSVVVVTGDSHSNGVQDVPPDFRDWDAAPVATEFMGTSLSSGGDRPLKEEYDPDLVNNPQERFRNNSRGYVTCHITRDQWQTDFRIVDTVESSTSGIRTLCSWVVDRDKPGAQLVGKPQ